MKTLQNSALYNVLQIICIVLPYSTSLINANGHHICHTEVLFKSFYLNCFEFARQLAGHKKLTCYCFESCSDLGLVTGLFAQTAPSFSPIILTLQLQAKNQASQYPIQHMPHCDTISINPCIYQSCLSSKRLRELGKC